MPTGGQGMMAVHEAWFVAAHAVATLLASYLAYFFAKSARVAPGRGLELLVVAFAMLGLGYVSALLDDGGFLRSDPTVEAARVAGIAASSVFLFSYYASRRGAWRLATTRAIVGAGAALALLYAGLYAVAASSSALPSPEASLGWVRLAGAVLLILTAVLVTLEVRASRLREFRVPLGFLCLAFSQYTVALLAFHGEPTTSGWAVGWRLAGLALLASVAFTSGGGARAGEAA